MMTIRTKTAQSLTEFAILISLLAVTFVGLQTFLRRGLQAHIKNTSDKFALQEDWTQTWYDYHDFEAAASISEGRQSGYRFNRIDSTGNLNTWDSTGENIEEITAALLRSAGY